MKVSVKLRDKIYEKVEARVKVKRIDYLKGIAEQYKKELRQYAALIKQKETVEKRMKVISDLLSKKNLRIDSHECEIVPGWEFKFPKLLDTTIEAEKLIVELETLPNEPGSIDKIIKKAKEL